MRGFLIAARSGFFFAHFACEVLKERKVVLRVRRHLPDKAM